MPGWKSAANAVVSAILLVLAFPDFEFWFLAWIGLIPLLWAIDREKESAARSLILGWLWGFVFFTGSCWWLTFAPITYAGFPWPIAYFLLLCVTAIVGIFPGVFGLIYSILVSRLGNLAVLAVPFVWVFTELLRYWVTGNNWNAIGYSQAFNGNSSVVELAAFGGIYLTGFVVLLICVCLYLLLVGRGTPILRYSAGGLALLVMILLWLVDYAGPVAKSPMDAPAFVIAIQPNVPMSGLTYDKWQQLRRKHVELSESALNSFGGNPESAIRTPQSTTVIFPESPMNFMYEDDEEFRNFVHAFAAKHDVQVLFNSAEPDGPNDRYFNSAVLVGPGGKEIGQYDKIYLVPFGESVPAPLQSIGPAFVGSFSYGKEYDLLPLGDAKAGVMICFESHFGELGREYVRNGADVIIEMTNDGYLGPTPVLRQHLANAVFRAVETNRPLLRVTNVGITAYITERGEVLEASEPYTETTRVWSVGKSDGSQTFYVRYGDWFAWLCSLVTIVMLGFGLSRPPQVPVRPVSADGLALGDA
ncbi:MAG TPA: apolipoprotein N-acyltransferase [Pyrinomonadaceae bacterium]